jgi:hypothetical protein
VVSNCVPLNSSSKTSL